MFDDYNLVLLLFQYYNDKHTSALINDASDGKQFFPLYNKSENVCLMSKDDCNRARHGYKNRLIHYYFDGFTFKRAKYHINMNFVAIQFLYYKRPIIDCGIGVFIKRLISPNSYYIPFLH